MTILDIDPNDDSFQKHAIKQSIKKEPIQWFLRHIESFQPITGTDAGMHIYGNMTEYERKIFDELLYQDSEFKAIFFNFVNVWIHHYDTALQCWKEANGLL